MSMNTEAQIRQEIDALRETASSTQELYRETCALLFFRYGITPTANKLYQLVKKGSMSAPAEALAKFWKELREKSRVRIEHPDLPESVKTLAGELVGHLWSEAQARAQESFSVFRADAHARTHEAETARQAADDARKSTVQELERTQAALRVAEERALELERTFAGERASNEALREQLISGKRKEEALEAALSDARKDFAAELEKLRTALQRSEERYEAAERRALLEIDRERTASARAQKELTQLRKTHLDVTEQHRTESAGLQRQLGDLRQELGVVEGGLAKMRDLNDHLNVELKDARTALANRDTQIALLHRDVELRNERIVALDLAVKEAREAALGEQPTKTDSSDRPKPRKRSGKAVPLSKLEHPTG